MWSLYKYTFTVTSSTCIQTPDWILFDKVKTIWIIVTLYCILSE